MTFSIRIFRPAHFLLAVLALTLAPALARAQSYPALPASHVLDDANVLTPAQEAELAKSLAMLKAETGVEMAVATVMSTADYGGFDGLESFVTGLFNDWGLGDAEKADGILLFLARADREVRIELGSGYGTAHDAESTAIIDEVMLPAFRAERYGDGVVAGTNAVITRLATPFATPAAASGGEATAAKGAEKGDNTGTILGVAGAVIAGLIGLVIFGAKRAKANRVCTACGAKGQVEIKNRTLQEPTETATGMGEKTTTCGACGHSASERYTIPRKSKPAAKPKSGGGKSEGGGASGKW